MLTPVLLNPSAGSHEDISCQEVATGILELICIGSLLQYATSPEHSADSANDDGLATKRGPPTAQTPLRYCESKIPQATAMSVTLKPASAVTNSLSFVSATACVSQPPRVPHLRVVLHVQPQNCCWQVSRGQTVAQPAQSRKSQVYALHHGEHC